MDLSSDLRYRLEKLGWPAAQQNTGLGAIRRLELRGYPVSENARAVLCSFGGLAIPLGSDPTSNAASRIEVLGGKFHIDAPRRSPFEWLRGSPPPDERLIQLIFGSEACYVARVVTGPTPYVSRVTRRKVAAWSTVLSRVYVTATGRAVWCDIEWEAFDPFESFVALLEWSCAEKKEPRELIVSESDSRIMRALFELDLWY
jgi:hypothetical protein